MQEIAKQYLTARVTGDYKKDLEVFKNTGNTAAETLFDALNQINKAVVHVDAGSSLLDKSSSQLSSSAAQQVSSLEENDWKLFIVVPSWN